MGPPPPPLIASPKKAPPSRTSLTRCARTERNICKQNRCGYGESPAPLAAPSRGSGWAPPRGRASSRDIAPAFDSPRTQSSLRAVPPSFHFVQTVRVRGIEPRSIAWEAIVLPLNYTRVGINLTEFPIPSEHEHALLTCLAGCRAERQRCRRSGRQRRQKRMFIERPTTRGTSYAATQQKLTNSPSAGFALPGPR